MHKYNPDREATNPKGKIWCKRSEGLECTDTGSIDHPGGSRVHALLALSCHTGVILAEPYDQMSRSFLPNLGRVGCLLHLLMHE